MRKVLVLYCSARKTGNSATLAVSFIKGALTKGHQVTEYFIPDKTIAPCLGCNYCQTHQGECIQKDDMQEVSRLLQEHDTLVIASPVYYLGFPGSFKLLLDRTYNESVIGRKITASILLTTACKQEAFVTNTLVQYYRSLADYLGWKNLGVISAKGVESPGEIAGLPCLDAAFQLGLEL